MSTVETTAVATLDNYVGAGWLAASAVDAIDDIDPATGVVAARVPLSGPDDVESAVRAAREAQPGWRAIPPQRRARAIMALREALWEHREELAQLVTADMGKTIDDARGEVLRGIESTESACAIPHLLKGENLEGVASGVDVELVRQPVGVVAAITPFNFPCMIPLWFLPFALATGNAFVLKPSERDPRPSVRIFELIDAIEEIPAGVANLVHGGRDAVNALLDHPEVDAISFVGQAATAMHVSRRAAATGKRAQALGGAKNSMVVMPDADLAHAVPAMLGSAFGNAGQRCLAGSVAVLVGDGERQEAVRDALVAESAKLKLGAGADPATDVSPLIAPEARQKIVDAVARAEGEGAQVLLDGRDAEPGPAETMLGPTIVEPTEAESELAREELFGPLLTLVRAPELDAALEFVNGSRYGNATAIFTASGASARAYRYGVEAGMVGVNVGVPAPVAWFPFAGWKDSMEGDLHANGLDAVEFYTRKKVLTSRWR
ncbi:MAG TPA: CoA-acylating methylmalonate-semialdehyde dehydrogenase [Solirubrobacterales bacterium]|jgi:malonate-semialdehyde dehydrogenase (acetylating)/methylmalonate-semialdehyde dehydrogenase|nr:CoA-acylating methylmalonate-semialdehyde dehydrogenase [Solirubrobacterales bacterium]